MLLNFILIFNEKKRSIIVRELKIFTIIIWIWIACKLEY